MDYVLLWLFCGIIACAIGAKKGEAIGALFIGLIFGPFGVLFALVSSGNRRPCPTCKELINKKATVCPRCQREVVR